MQREMENPNRRTLLILLLVASQLSGWAQVRDANSPPLRAKGISMHMLPKRAAELGGDEWGLQVDHASYLKPEASKPVLQTTEEFVSYVHKQDSSVQQNGVWIVTTHPDAYSDEEKALLEGIKALSKKENIILFVCRASELPNGWKRYGN